MASNEEILKSIHAEKVINWNQIFRQNPTIIESAYEAMDAARKDEAVAFGNWILQNAYHKEGCWYLYKDMSGEIYTTEQLYTIFKQQNS
jgi:hypothetical protein